jgi:gliding motility-associated-like protein
MDCNEVVLSSNNSQWFFLQAYDINGCLVFDSVYLQILDQPEVSDTIYFCAGDTVMFNGIDILSDTVLTIQNLDCNVLETTHLIEQQIEFSQSVSGDCQSGYVLTLDVLNEVSPSSFNWDDPNGNGNSVGPVDPGVYSVTITDGNNCSLELDLEIEEESEIAAFIEPCYFLNGTSPVTLHIDVDMSLVDEILWTPSVGLSCADCVSTEVLLSADQAYEILITDLNGCEYFLETKVVVDVDDIGVVLPNIFSPNGDATNDLFEIESSIPFVYDLSIYDRWGNVVFNIEDAQSNEPKYYWDGRMNGQSVADGVYVFHFSVEALNINQSGSITVIK